MQIIERLNYLENRAESTRRAEEAARAATKEAKEATRRAEEASDKCAQLIKEMGGISAVPGNREKGASVAAVDVSEELEGLKRSQKRLQDELLSKSSQISSISMAQEDAFRSLNMLTETCRLARAESERASSDIQGLQMELRRNGANSQAANVTSGAPLDASIVDRLRQEVAALQQQVASANSSSSQQIQQMQKNVSSIVDFAEKASARHEAVTREVADIKQHLLSKGINPAVSAPPQARRFDAPSPPESSSNGVEALRKDVEELAMAMGEVAGRFSSMEQDITQAFASCARAVDVKEIENHLISRSTALEDKVAALGKQLNLIKENHISSPPTHGYQPRQSEGYTEGERGGSQNSRESHPLLSSQHQYQSQPQLTVGQPGVPRAWGTPQSQPGMMSMGMMQPMVPVQVMPMHNPMQPGMVQFQPRAGSSPSSAQLAAMTKQGMMQQAQASAGRFTRMSNDGDFASYSYSGPSSSAASSQQQQRAQHPSNRVLKVKPDEGTGRESPRDTRLQSFSRPQGDPSSPQRSLGPGPGPSSGPLLSANPPAAPFLSRLQLQEAHRASADGRMDGRIVSPPQSGGSAPAGPHSMPGFLEESMLSQMQAMTNGSSPHHGYGKQ